MIKYYQSYFKRLRNKHDQLIKAVLDSMIDAGIAEYEATGMVTTLPIAELTKSLTELHLDAGVRWAKYTRKTIEQKSTKAYERKAVGDEYLAFMREYLNRNLLDKSVLKIEKTERDLMLKIIIAGLENGDNPNKTAGKLKDLKLGTARSRLIVRTETGRAMNTGAMFAAADSNVVVNKIWNSAQNDRTRRIPRDKTDHLRMNGVKVAYNEWFFVPGMKGIDLMQYPCDPAGSAGNVCNCRCAVSFEPTNERRDVLARNEFIDIIEFVRNNVTLNMLNALNNG
jgi:hypothetical protein